jgi:hypothetical protein
MGRDCGARNRHRVAAIGFSEGSTAEQPDAVLRWAEHLVPLGAQNLSPMGECGAVEILALPHRPSEMNPRFQPPPGTTLP